MTELNKDSFLYYFIKETRGRHDPALLTKMIEALKEWLPDEVGYPETGYDYDAYKYGQGEYKDYLMRNLK
jgi:hypothetical protein